MPSQADLLALLQLERLAQQATRRDYELLRKQYERCLFRLHFSLSLSHCFVIPNQSSFASQRLRLVKNRGFVVDRLPITSGTNWALFWRFSRQIEGGAGMARFGSRRRYRWPLVRVDQWSRSRLGQRTHAADSGAQELELAQHDAEVSVSEKLARKTTTWPCHYSPRSVDSRLRRRPTDATGTISSGATTRPPARRSTRSRPARRSTCGASWRRATGPSPTCGWWSLAWNRKRTPPDAKSLSSTWSTYAFRQHVSALARETNQKFSLTRLSRYSPNRNDESTNRKILRRKTASFK